MKKLFLSLMMMVLPSIVSAYDFEVNGICYTVTSFEEFTVAVDGFNESLSGTVEIPSSITYSNKYFSVTTIKSGRSNRITTVLIPSSITEIGNYAFSGSSIQKIEIPDNVSSIGKAAFKGCTQLYSVRISKNVTILNQELFEGCTNLTNIDWHPETTYGNIRGRVFYNCTSLKTIRIPAGISLSGGIDGSGVGASTVSIFKNCVSLDSLIVEDGEGTLRVRYNHYAGDYYGEFTGSKISYVYLGRALDANFKYSNEVPILRYVEHLEIGDKVTELPTWLPNQQNYGDAKHLKTLIIGSSLTKVADFSNSINLDGPQGNHSLEFIKMKGSTPPEAVGFSNYNYINTIVYVPKGSKAAYESANIWKNFWNIQEYTEDIENIVAQIRANAILIQSHDGLVSITGVENGQNISVYNPKGIMVGSAKSIGETTCVSTGIRRGEIVIIKIGERTVKHMMK